MNQFPCTIRRALLVAGMTAIAAAAPPATDRPAPIADPDLEACMAAGAPGPMHEQLARSIGVWHGRTTMWPTPGGEPLQGACTQTVTSILDGRFIQFEVVGELPGMGPFKGLGLAGFDNVSRQFVSSWVDNHGSGIMQGIGELSADGSTRTWRYTFNCPRTRRPATMREVETFTGPDASTFEMFAAYAATGAEHRCMRIEYVRRR